MPYRLEADEFGKIIALSSEERYQHFLKKVADWEELWALSDGEGWVVQATSDNRPYITLWPHPEFAKDAVKRFLPGNEVEEIDFEFLLEQCIPLLKREGIAISILPNHEWQAVLLSADQFEADLREEMTNYE